MPFAGRFAGRRRSATLVAAAVLSALSGCGAPAIETHLAEFLPFSASGVDTDLIFPRVGASRFLHRNWPPMQGRTEDAVWVHGNWARIRFFAVADEAPTFVAEARPFSHPNAPAQLVTLRLNDRVVEAMPMNRRWRTYEVPLPDDAMRFGWNEIELRFEHALRPADFDPDSEDRRTLAAQFRRIELRGAAGRSPWPARPEDVGLAPIDPLSPSISPARGDVADAIDPATLSIDMPVDSLFEVYVAPTEATELIGEAHVELAEGTTGSVRAILEVIEPAEVTRLWESVLETQRPAATVNVSLAEWAGKMVALRVRVAGNANGVVRWTRLGTTTAAHGSGALPPNPAALAAPPRSGLLERPDIVLVILDAARGDAFAGARGIELAPTVDGLADEGTRFSAAWAPSAWTGQSMPALFSGMTPDAIGAENWSSRLPEPVTTIAQILRAAGYRTVLWSQHNIYRADRTLRRGFDVYEEVGASEAFGKRELLPSVADLVSEEQPTFAVIHLLPPHDPYRAPPPFGGSRSGWYQGDIRVTAQLLNQFDARVPPHLQEEVVRYAISLYEENVRFADHLVGRLIDDLAAAGRYEDAMVLVTSDHGEAFREHGRFLHEWFVYEEFLHVPLVIKWPAGLSGFEADVASPVSLIDIAPTIVDLLGLDDERAVFQGRSLAPLVMDGRQSNRAIYAYTSGQSNPRLPARPRYALRWRGIKLVYDEYEDTARLFRLASDPGEQADIAAASPFEAGILMQALRQARSHNAAILLGFGGTQVEALDEETIESLRALGYLR